MRNGLVSIVMLAFLVIGCAGFAAFQWLSTQQDAPQPTAGQGLARLLADYREPNRANRKPVAVQASRQLKEASAKLAKMVATSSLSSQAAGVTLQLVDDVDRACQEIQERPTTAAVELEAANSTRLEAYYYAAQLAPESHRDRFDQLAKSQLANARDSRAAAQIEILQFMVERDLSQPLDDSSFRAVVAKSKSFSESVYGVALYSIVADKLSAHGQVDSAIMLLEYSLAQYDGMPGRRQLLDQLIALRQPPSAEGFAFAKQRKGKSHHTTPSGSRGNVWRPTSLDTEIFQKEWAEKVARDRAIHNGQ